MTSLDDQLDFMTAVKLLTRSGIFDENYYRRAYPSSMSSPLEHYLLGGWRNGFEPSPSREFMWLWAYYASVGMSDAPALTYVTLKMAGVPTFPTRADAERAARVIRSSGFFDATAYAQRVGHSNEIDPALHYVIIGEHFGYAPSARFDPTYYRMRYPEIGFSSQCLLQHYITIGRRNGLRPISLASELHFDEVELDRSRETILVISHEASHTGAPILAYNIAERLCEKYNVITLVLSDGELMQDFASVSAAVIGPITSERDWVGIEGINHVEGQYIAKRLKATYPIKYAIVNSIESATTLKPLMCEMIPSVTLVHEFAGNVRTRGQPLGDLARLLTWTDRIVFSSETAADSLRRECSCLMERPVNILRVGRCEAPSEKKSRRKLHIRRSVPTEFLSSDNVIKRSAIPHFDIGAATARISKWAKREQKRRECSSISNGLAQTKFNIGSYVDRLDSIGSEAEQSVRLRLHDFETIRNDSTFDMLMFLEPDAATETTRDDAIRLFLARSSAFATSTQPNDNFSLRRPCAGFHPQVYFHENRSHYDARRINPLADFLRKGQPDGPWQHNVITSPAVDEVAASVVSTRIAIQGHFYYPELVTNFLDKLSVNRLRPDLLLSTSDHNKAALLGAATKAYGGGKVIIRVVPNRGRDIGALLTGFADLIPTYDYIGHVHGKRSPHMAHLLMGEKWREFSWQNLLGGFYPMADHIVRHFEAMSSLGLVFAADPHLSGWDLNRSIATELAQRMGIPTPLPPFFDFPLGTMFWARSRALEPLTRLRLGWEDYPAEPAPLDGSIIHALERLLAFVSGAAGYDYATTSLSGITW